MQKPENLVVPDGFLPVIAELWSHNRADVVRFTFRGYEREEEWVVVDVEYESPYVSFKRKRWEFDTKSIVWAIRRLREFRGARTDCVRLVDGPYRLSEKIDIQYKPYALMRRRRRTGEFPRFAREFQGFYIDGQIDRCAFEFKTTRANLLRFRRELERAAEGLPVRSQAWRTRLGLE